CSEPRSAKSDTDWVMMLQAIISGTASVGGNTCSRMAPATAEKANPISPDTTAPAKIPALTSRHDTGSSRIDIGLARTVSALRLCAAQAADATARVISGRAGCVLGLRRQ